jgi:hypothetical protein
MVLIPIHTLELGEMPGAKVFYYPGEMLFP